MSDTLDEAELAEEYEDDTELLSELTASFYDSVPQLLTDMRASIASGDGEALASAAHKIKGSSGNFFAAAAYDLASSLEQKGNAGNLDGADTDCEKLAAELDQLKEALQQFIESH